MRHLKLKVLSDYLYCFILLLLPVFLTAQSKLNYSLQKRLINQASYKTSPEVHVLIKGDISSIKNEVENFNGTFKYNAGGIASVRIPLTQLNALAEKNFITRIEDFNYKIISLNDRVIVNNNVLIPHLGYQPLSQSYTGSGVLIGFIDTEIDYSHADFKQTNGESRILYIWDHTIANPGKIPQPYGYGQEWAKSEIDANVPAAHISGNRTTLGHGTHVAGTAAGNGLMANNYTGVAPDASIIIVALDFNLETDNWLASIADATHYIYSKADSLGLPCVINASVGTYYGSHDAKDLQAQIIDSLITEKSGRSFVCAAGNAGNIPFHLSYNVTSDTSFTWLAPTFDTLSFEVWSDAAGFDNVLFALGADKISPEYEYRGNTKFYKKIDNLNTLISDTLFNNTNRIGIINTYSELTEGRYVLSVDIIPDSIDYYWRFITTGTGKFDMWSFNLIASGVPDPSQYPPTINYKYPDNNMTTTSSFACSKNVITVGSYVNRNSYVDVNTTLQNLSLTKGEIIYNSSLGPTREGNIKPDITATGDYTLSCVAMAKRTSIIANNPETMAAGGYHVRMSGTSTSSPVVAGIAALYFQQNPDSNYASVINSITASARRDVFTGSSLPDNQWGYGKADALGALLLPVKYGCMYENALNYDPLATIDDGSCIFVGISEKLSLNKEKILLYNYPNPFNYQTSIYYEIPAHENYKNGEIKICDVLGKVQDSFILNDNKGQITFSNNHLNSGIYFYYLLLDGYIIMGEKLIIK